MRKRVAGLVLIIVGAFIGVFSCGPSWELEFRGISNEMVQIDVFRGSRFVEHIDCVAPNTITTPRRIRLRRGTVELPVGHIEEFDFTILPGRAVVRVGAKRITLQENGITVRDCDK